MEMSIASVVQNASQFVQPKYTFIVGKLAIKTGIVGVECQSHHGNLGTKSNLIASQRRFVMLHSRLLWQTN